MAAILDAILDFGKSSWGIFRGLLVCYSTHIPRTILKYSACYMSYFHHLAYLVECSWPIGWIS
jgi:hypothetical protein